MRNPIVLVLLACPALGQATLSQVSPAEPGQFLELFVEGATPSAPMFIGFSSTYVDPPLTIGFGDLYLGAPIQSFPLGTTLLGGTLSTSLLVPNVPALVGELFHSQALDMAAGELTNPIGVWIGPPESIDSPNAEVFGVFGSAVAVGDFLGSSDLDIAVGAPNETVSGAAGAGRVYVFEGPGFDSVLTIEGAQVGGNFGASLAALDWSGDGLTDLAVGEPGLDLPFGFSSAGAVHVYGYPVGAGTIEMLVDPTPAASQTLGASLAAANLDAFPDDEIVAGAFYADGSQPPTVPASVLVFDFGAPAVELFEPLPFLGSFGEDVAVGDTNADGAPEILVGEPAQEIAGVFFAGQVHLFDVDGGLVATVPNPDPDFGDRFGGRVLVGDLDGDGVDDVLVGDDGENGVRLLPGPALLATEVFPAVKPGDLYQFGDIARADVNGDGNLDLVFADGGCLAGAPCGAVSYYLGPSFVAAGFLNPPTTSLVSGLRLLDVADLDGDGEDEVIGGAAFANPGVLPSAGQVLIFR